ncbi:MAG: hypothetical protein EU521_01555 [Promethearchaeota archaeon]|nr:MAG: hypothetical protein EU521_01555 [Candidatus Lokiarchaeota archaeon]
MTSEIKEEVIDLIKKLPDDVTLEDIQYHLFVKQKLKIAENQIKEGNTIPHYEVMERIKKKWFK